MNKAFRRVMMLVIALALAATMIITAYGYWVDSIDAECVIPVRYGTEILITGLTAPEAELEPEVEPEPEETGGIESDAQDVSGESADTMNLVDE